MWPVLTLLSLFVGLGGLELQAEVKLNRISVETSEANDWSSVHFELENRGADDQEVVLKLIMGDVESGVSSVDWSFLVPSRSKYARSLPIFIPVKEQASRSSQRGQSKSGPPKSGLSSLRRRSQVRSFKAEAQLLLNGALIQRESMVGALAKQKFLKSTQWKKLDGYLSFEDPRALYTTEQIQGLELRLGGQNMSIKSSSKRGASTGPMTSQDLADQRAVWLSERAFEDSEVAFAQTLSLNRWLRSGGLLILEATEERETTLAAFYGYRPTGPQVAELQFRGQKFGPFFGTRHGFDDSWQILKDEAGISYGATKVQGLGRLVVLNLPWKELVGGSKLWAEDALSRWLPEHLNDIVTMGNGSKEAKALMRSQTGKDVWGKNQVAVFLASLLILAFVVSKLSYFKERSEWRWAMWMALVVVWTAAGLTVYLLSVDLKTKANAVHFVMKSPDGPEVQQWGSVMVISGEKRRFDLEFEAQTHWYRELGKTFQLAIDAQHWLWKDFSLAPQVEESFHFSKLGSEAHDVTIDLSVGKQWHLSLPSSWKGESYLVVGRQYWILKNGGKHELKFSEAKSFHSIDDESDDLCLNVFKSDENRLNLRHNVWLLRSGQGQTSDWNWPEDIELQTRQIEMWKVHPHVKKGEAFQLPAGTCEWSFVRAGKERSDSRAFNGHHLDLAGSMEMMIRWPSWLRDREIDVKSMDMVFAEPVSSMTYKMARINSRGKEKNIALKGRSIRSPLDDKKALERGELLHFKVSPRSSRRTPTTPDVERGNQHFPFLGIKIEGIVK